MSDNNSNNNRTTIAVSVETREKLKQFGFKDDDYDTIIENCMRFKQKFDNEAAFHLWFKEHFDLFGFEELVEENKNRFPDFVLMKDGKKVRVELETVSKNFIVHRHNPTDVDIVICLINNVDLSIPTIEITPFDFEIAVKRSIKVSLSLYTRLVFAAGYKQARSGNIVSIEEVVNDALCLFEQKNNFGGVLIETQDCDS